MTRHDDSDHTTDPATHHPIVCAIGDHGSTAALAFAADEAQRTGSPLHLVHVSGDSHSRQTDALLLRAMVAVRASHPDVLCSRDTVDSEWIAAGLATAGRRARYVVMERTQRGRIHRLLGGSTADGVAFKVTSPVLSVPPDQDHHEPRPHVVTVAVQDAAEVPALVALAAGEASSRGADLVVLHAVSRHRDLGTRGTGERHDWLDRAHLELDGPVRDAVAGHPDLKVRLDLTRDRPVESVLRAAAVSELVVLGRRHLEHAWGTHLGPVVRHVLRDAECPVLLAPEPDSVDSATARERDEREVAEAAAHVLTPGDMVLAVGEDDAGGSVRFAVAEAQSRDVGLHLVHVVRMPAVDGVTAADVWRDAVAHAENLLERAAVEARSCGGPDFRITRRLVERGTLVGALVAEAATAGALVLQHRRLGTARRWLTWSVTNGVAARSDVPVIAVPAEWNGGPEQIGCVVVGVQDLEDVQQVLPVALEEAARRGIALRVVHAGRLSEREEEALGAAVEALHRDRPEITVNRVFEDRDPVDLLVGAVTSPEIVVVGRRHRALSHRSHLGPVTRSVLDTSPYPVLLTPPV